MNNANRRTRDAWNANAAFWDEKMGEGNDFVEKLIWPSTERLLNASAGQHILDIACGNGLACRKLAAMGIRVTGVDFAEEMIKRAKAHEVGTDSSIQYLVVDVSDEAALIELRRGQDQFDSAICNMALFDMAAIEPLARALPELLKPGAVFVFSVTHPCFNHSGMSRAVEISDDEGVMVTRHSVKVWQYMTSTIAKGIAIVGQPEPQLYFDRPLHTLLSPFFSNGLVVDALDERAFPAENATSDVGWHNFSEIPAVMVVRMRVT